MVDTRKVGIYIILTFALSWGIFGLINLKWIPISNEAIGMAIASMMFAPAIAAIIVKRMIYREPMNYGFGFSKYEYLILAWLIPVAFALVSLALTLMLGFAKFDPTMKEYIVLFPKHLVEQGIPPFYVIFLFSLFLPVLVNILFTIGEELGWRGFLQDELRPLGQIRSFFIIGCVWGIWHAPVVVMGYSYSGHPLLGPLWMLLFCILVSYIFGWLKDKAESLWAPIIAHASLNGPAMSSMLVLAGMERLWGGIFGVVGLAVMSGFVIWLIRTGNIK